MPLTNIPDLSFEIDGDLIRLEQNDSGNVDAIVLHHLHLSHLAKECGLLAPARLSPQRHQERALLRLWYTLDLMAAPCWLDEIVDRVGDGLAYRAYVHDATDTLEDIMEDLGIAIPASINVDAPEELSNENSPSPRNEKSSNGDSNAAIFVTPKRGRPATGQALSSAERQARHRAKQAELIPAGDGVVAEETTA